MKKSLYSAYSCLHFIEGNVLFLARWFLVCHSFALNHGLNLEVQCVNVGYNLFNFSRLNFKNDRLLLLPISKLLLVNYWNSQVFYLFFNQLHIKFPCENKISIVTSTHLTLISSELIRFEKIFIKNQVVYKTLQSDVCHLSLNLPLRYILLFDLCSKCCTSKLNCLYKTCHHKQGVHRFYGFWWSNWC